MKNINNTNNTTVLITGARGFLGRHVAKRYCQEGFAVMGVGHGLWSSKEWEAWGLSEWHSGDVTIENILLCTQKPDVIVHCAGGGSVAYSMQSPAEDFRRTVETTSQVLEYIRIHAPKAKLVYPSSAAVYGNAGTSPISVNQPPAPVSPYGVHKHMAEQLCSMYARQYGVNAIMIRLFSVYGPELRKQLLWDASRKIREGDFEFQGTGEETRDWLHVSDCSALLFEAYKHANDLCKVVNGGRGQPVKVSRVIALLMKELGIAGNVRCNGISRTGDPHMLVADISECKSWSWRSQISIEQGIGEYVSWLNCDN
jgi:UDP-glucose 4-epimerase